MKLAGGSAVTGGGSVGPVKLQDGVVGGGVAKPRRPKATKRKKPGADPVTANTTGAASSATMASLSRLDGLTSLTAAGKSDSGIKQETESLTGGDDSGINMADTWQRNGHSADFIRHSLDGLPSSALSSGPGSAPPPSSNVDHFGALPGSGAPLSDQLQQPPPCSSTSSLPAAAAGQPPVTADGCGPSPGGPGQRPPTAGGGGGPGPLGQPLMDGGGPGSLSGFLPQQNQVFVFSTTLANQAADAVERGVCRTIIDYHLEQPRTRQFLQSLSAGGPHPHPHSYTSMPFGPPDGPPHMGDPAMGPPPPDGAGDMGGGSALANVELWVQQQNATLQEGPFSPSFGPTSSQPMPIGHRSRSNGDVAGMPPRCCPGPHHPGGEFGPGPGGDPMFGGPQPPPGYPLEHPHMMRGIAGARVPDENLTPEQLQRREEQLAHLQKIKQMLFPEKQGAAGFEGGPPPRYAGGPPPGMFRGPVPPEDMPPHPHMIGQPQRYVHPGGPGMMMPPGGMMDQPVPPEGMIMMGGPPFGEHGLPQNWEMMTNEEREWFRLQQEYYMEQRQKRQLQLQQQMAGGPQPPPGFFGDMPRQPPGRASGPLSPVSPSFNGPSPNDPQAFFFQGQPGMNFPPGRGNFPPNGPGVPPNFNPEFVHHPEGGFPPYGNPMMLPEPGAVPGNRFPPGYGKKRKRGNAAACMPPCPTDRPGDDIFRHLQPAPSPQQFCSLNLFDGQELTITKQLNLAYQEPPTSASPSTQAPASTPPTTAPSRKKKKSNNDVRIKSELAEAGVSSPAAGPTASEASDSVSDRPAVSPSASSGSRSAAGTGPITSATLASLARGVENLSDRIQADMLRGGPFGAVQMPEPDEIGEGEERRTGAGGSQPAGDVRNQRCLTEPPLQPNPDSLPTLDQSPTSAGICVKQDPTSLLSPQPVPNDSSIPVSSRPVATSVQSPNASMVGNASVQIEPRAPNTIQYLPTRPPTSSDLAELPGGVPPEGGEMFRQVGPGQFCPNGPAGMLPPGYDGPLPPGYTGPMGRFEGGPAYGEPLSPSAMAHRGCGPPVQFQGDMMFPDGVPGGPHRPVDGPMMHSGAGPVPYSSRPMFYRGGGPIPPPGGPVYQPGQPPPGVMVHPDFRDGGPERHGQLMAMQGMPRPGPGGGQMVMMGPGRPPMLPAEQPPPVPTNPAPTRSRNESRSKKSKDSKRRAEAAAARQNAALAEENAAMMAGRPDQRGPPPGHFGGPGSVPGPPMGFTPNDGPGIMMMDRVRPGSMMMGPDGSPGMIRHPDGMIMSPEEFEMMRAGAGPPGSIMTSDGRMLVPRSGGGMRTDQAMMMMAAGKGGLRPGEGDMMPGGPPMMMPVGPHEMEMRGGDPGMMGPGDMRPGSGMMLMNEMRGGPGMLGPNEMRQGPGGMMGPRPGSGVMTPGEMRPGSAVLGPVEGRPGSGMLIPGDMNPAAIPPNEPHRPGSGMVVMSPRDDGSIGDASRLRPGNGKGSFPPSADGSRPESVGKRSEAELMQINSEAAMRMGANVMPQGNNPGRPPSKVMSLEGEMRPSSVAGMEQMDGQMRPGSAAMMGPGDSRIFPGGQMIVGPDGGMRPGSALMMGMGAGDGAGMRPRSELMMGMDPAEMAMRPSTAEMMLLEGGNRPPGGGAAMMGMNAGEPGGMRPGPDMMGMSVGDARMRPPSAAMMMGMGPTSEGPMMSVNPGGDPGMLMMGPGGEPMPMMGMNPGEFDPRNCPPEMISAQRMGSMGPRMMSPGEQGLRYDGAGPMMPMRVNRPRGELDFRMMGGMDPSLRGVQYGPGMRNGGVYPPPSDRQMMMMMMGGPGGGNGGPPNPGGPMPPNDFSPGMGPLMSGMGQAEGAQFQQFQQQLYATKGHHSQQGPGSPMMMVDSRAGGPPGGNFPVFDPVQNGPRFPGPGPGVM